MLDMSAFYPEFTATKSLCSVFLGSFEFLGLDFVCVWLCVCVECFTICILCIFVFLYLCILAFDFDFVVVFAFLAVG